MQVLSDTFSPLELCDLGDYRAAGELAGLRVGERPSRGSDGILTHADRLLLAGIISTCAGEIRQAKEMLTDAADLFGDDPRADVARSWLAWAEYWSGDFDAALTLASEVLTAQIEASVRFRTLLLRVSIYSDQGFPDRAWAGLKEMALLYDSCDPLLKGKFHGQRGRVLRMLNEPDRAIVEYSGAIDFFQQAGNIRCEAAIVNNLVRLYLDAGHFTEAHDYAQRAISLWRETTDKPYEAEAWDHEALIFLAEGKPNEAETAILKAVGLAGHGSVQKTCLATYIKIKNTLAQDPTQEGDTIAPCGTNRGLPSHNPTLPKGTAVMDPLACASLIPPELASVVLDLLIFATSGITEPQHKAQLEAAEDALYVKTPDFEKHRDDYRRSRLIHEVTDS